jgi:hypothetical protein
MATDVTVVLDRLHCVRESDGNGHSEPYIWPTLLWIDNATLNTPELVGVTAPPDRFARVQVRGDMQSGETAEIPASVRELTARVDEAGFRALILVVALWEHDETPRAAVVAGYRAFSAELQAAVAGHLQALASSDPQEQDQAVKEITKQVNERVEEAIRDELGIGNVFDDIDDVVGSDILAFTALPGQGAPAPVSLGFGAEQGGRLLFYRDANQDGTGDVANPAVIGLGGWQNILRLFSAGNGILYAVDRPAALLPRPHPGRYRRRRQPHRHRPGRLEQLPPPLLRRQRHPLRRRPARPAALLPRHRPGRHRRRRQPHRHWPGRLA